jgi:NAD(P)-dependent dehydrogenase (short-subunit alcohol dehydrogenase family)
MPGKNAVITGAGGGLGLAIARALAARGLRVHLTDIDGAAAQRAAESIPGATGAALDVRDAEACSAAAREVTEAGGSLDVWVNNAGIIHPGLSFEQSAETHRQMLDVNYVGTLNGTLAALAQMRPAGAGHIINIVSLAGLIAPPGEVGYAASKHAALAFTLGTLTDLRRAGISGIELSAVCPDGIWTPMLEDRVDDPELAISYSGTMLTPERVATEVAGLLDRPRPFLAIPRWRGWQVRAFAALPRFGLRFLPFAMAQARRRQKRFKKRVEAGNWPK